MYVPHVSYSFLHVIIRLQATTCFKFVSVILKTETNKLLLDKLRQQLKSNL